MYGIAAVADNGDTRWRRSPNSGHTMLDELHAIGLALEWLAEGRIAKALILCDNTGAVKAMYGLGDGGPTGVRELARTVRADLGAHVVAWVPREANAAANAHARRTVGGADHYDIAAAPSAPNRAPSA